MHDKKVTNVLLLVIAVCLIFIVAKLYHGNINMVSEAHAQGPNDMIMGCWINPTTLKCEPKAILVDGLGIVLTRAVPQGVTPSVERGHGL